MDTQTCALHCVNFGCWYGACESLRVVHQPVHIWRILQDSIHHLHYVPTRHEWKELVELLVFLLFCEDADVTAQVSRTRTLVPRANFYDATSDARNHPRSCRVQNRILSALAVILRTKQPRGTVRFNADVIPSCCIFVTIRLRRRGGLNHCSFAVNSRMEAVLDHDAKHAPFGTQSLRGWQH
jgi:hypothetical protein